MVVHADTHEDCDCAVKSLRRRAERLRSLARFLRDAPVRGGAYAKTDRESTAAQLWQLAERQDQAAGEQDGDWDEDPMHLAQALDAVLDEALEAFQSDQVDQGVALTIGAAATADQLLEAMNAPDADEPDQGGQAGAPGNQFASQGLRAVDNSSWDGNAAMSKCTSAACFRAICAGRKSGPPDQQSSWALPHHKSAGSPPNAAAVRNALARLSQTQGLTNREVARRHLEAHMSSIKAGSSSQSSAATAPRDDLYRAVRPGYELREAVAGDMPTLLIRFAVFDDWARIESLFEGSFMERLKRGAMKVTFKEERDAMRVLFQHGRDPYIGQKLLGPIEVLEEQPAAAYAEVPLDDTSYNRDLLPGLRRGGYGASFRFQVLEDSWDQEPKRSSYNPDGLPERTITRLRVLEFGPVTFPAYSGTSTGVRSITDEFVDVHVRMHTDEHLTGRPGAWSAGGGDSGQPPGHGAAPEQQLSPSALRTRDRVLRMKGVI